MRNTRVKKGNKYTTVKVNNRNLVELILGRIVLDIILGIIATGFVLGIFWILGGIVWLCETYLIARIILFLSSGWLIFKMVDEAE